MTKRKSQKTLEITSFQMALDLLYYTFSQKFTKIRNTPLADPSSLVTQVLVKRYHKCLILS